MLVALFAGLVALASARGFYVYRTIPLVGQFPLVDVDAAVENGQVVFDIRHKGCNGLLWFAVDGERGEDLWKLELGYATTHRIAYGESPRFGKQVFPAGNQPPADIRGKPVTVTVGYQYDRFEPSLGRCQKTLRIP
jgi:hypothetical protein